MSGRWVKVIDGVIQFDEPVERLKSRIAALEAALQQCQDRNAIAHRENDALGADFHRYRDKSEARIAALEAALRTIANADRSYPDKKIADDCQYCARTALETKDDFVPTGAGGNPRAFVCCEGVGKHESWCSESKTGDVKP